MPKRIASTLATILTAILVPCFAAAQSFDFGQLQTRAAKTEPHASSLHAAALSVSNGTTATKAEIPQKPPYGAFYAVANPDTEDVSLRMFVSGVSFVPAGPMGVRLDGKPYGTLPQRNGLQRSDATNPPLSDYTLETEVKTNLPFGTTRARLVIPFSGDAYYAFTDIATVPFGDFFDACIVADANGNPTDYVDLYTRLRGYSLDAPAPQANYLVSSNGFVITAQGGDAGARPSPVWLYSQMHISDYYANFVTVPGAPQNRTLSIWVDALERWLTFESWYPFSLGICAKG